MLKIANLLEMLTIKSEPYSNAWQAFSGAEMLRIATLETIFINGSKKEFSLISNKIVKKITTLVSIH